MNRDYLSDMQDQWQDTKAKERNDYPELPDGDYQVMIETAQLKTGQSDIPFLQWGMMVMSGRYEGRKVFKTQQITKEGLPYLKADLELLHALPEQLSDLVSCLPYALDAILDIRIKTGKKQGDTVYKNVYFNRLIQQGREGAQQSAIPSAVDTDKLPWE